MLTLKVVTKVVEVVVVKVKEEEEEKEQCEAGWRSVNKRWP